MKWSDVGDQPCSIARTLSVIGDRWTALVIRNAFLGIRRFEDFQKSMGVTRPVLTDRLNTLVEQEVLTKVPYTETGKRFEYRLTAKGLDLYPIIMSMMKWGNTWMDEGLGAPVEYTHLSCGHKFQPLLVCSACKEEINPKNVQPSPGPGFYAYYVKKSQTG